MGKVSVKESDIKMVMEEDEYSVPDWLGKVVPVREWEEGAIKYVDPRDGGKGWFIPENPEYGKEDFAQFMEWVKGNWFFVGVYAEAKIVVRGTTQRIRTPGLWAIESISDGDYLDEVYHGERELLLNILGDLGIEVATGSPATQANDLVGLAE